MVGHQTLSNRRAPSPRTPTPRTTPRWPSSSAPWRRSRRRGARARGRLPARALLAASARAARPHTAPARPARPPPPAPRPQRERQLVGPGAWARVGAWAPRYAVADAARRARCCRRRSGRAGRSGRARARTPASPIRTLSRPPLAPVTAAGPQQPLGEQVRRPRLRQQPLGLAPLGGQVRRRPLRQQPLGLAPLGGQVRRQARRPRRQVREPRRGQGASTASAVLLNGCHGRGEGRSAAHACAATVLGMHHPPASRQLTASRVSFPPSLPAPSASRV